MRCLDFESRQGFFMKASSFSVFIIFLFSQVAIVATAQEPPAAQQQHGPSHTTQSESEEENMPDMPGMHHDEAHGQPATFIDEILHHATTGTSAEPDSTAEPMIMRPLGKWLFMFHGTAFQSTLQQ